MASYSLSMGCCDHSIFLGHFYSLALRDVEATTYPYRIFLLTPSMQCNGLHIPMGYSTPYIHIGYSSSLSMEFSQHCIIPMGFFQLEIKPGMLKALSQQTQREIDIKCWTLCVYPRYKPASAVLCFYNPRGKTSV